MKKLLAFLFLFALVTAACSDDNDNNNGNSGPTGLTKRLIGTWDMTELSYSTQVINPLNPLNPIDVQGDAQNVDGTFIVNNQPNSVDYFYSFSIVDSLLPIPVPVQANGSGTWEVIANDTKVLLTEDGESIIYDVLVDEPARQVWSGTIPFTPPGGGPSIDSDIEFTLIKR